MFFLSGKGCSEFPKRMLISIGILRRSPYDNGDYIYSENGCPMDFVSAMRFQDEMYEWWMSLSEEEREQELRELRGDYDTVSDSIIINTEWSDPVMDPDAELPFS